MKLSKRGWMIIVTAVFAIAVASLAAIYFQHVQQQKQLDKELIQVQANLEQAQVTKLVSDQTKWEVQLGEATSRLGTVNGLLSRPLESAIVTKTLFSVAEVHSLEVIEMTASVPTKGNLAGVDFSTISLTTRVKGKASNIIDFVIDLNGRFSTGIIDSVAITIPGNSTGDGATADVRMVIYTYKEGL